MINSQFSGKWSEKPLSDLAVITMGQSPSSIFYNSQGEGLPLIQGNADIEARKTIERVWTIEGNKRCDLGDLILTVRAPVGAVAVASKNAYIGRGVCGLKPFGNSNFLFHALVHAEDQWQALEQGSTFTAANSEQVGQFRLFVPEDENEQRAIAKALSDVDGLLNALEALIAKKRAIKQATLQQLLTGKTRLPGFSGEWETKRVSEFGDVITGATPSTKIDAFWDGAYPWITPTDITSKRDMTVSERMITQEGLNAIRTLRPNTVLVTCIASIGKNAILRTTGGCNQQINAVTPNGAHNVEFLYYLFEFNSNYLLANAGITATNIVSKAAFSNLVFEVPPPEEQHAIASVLSDMDAEIAALEQRRDKTIAIKQGMMQQLLTGRVRLVKPSSTMECSTC